MDYKDTLNLPKTDFPMKANLAQKEPEQLKLWDEKQLYHQIVGKNKNNPKYVLHDGPPYANGHLHLGTILNKILKDIVVKYKNMSGFLCEYIPGWDCHGLPIEHDVDKKLGSKKHSLESIVKRKACREHAGNFLNIQRDEFKRLGCLGRWENPYQTMSFDYEATIEREFGKFVSLGSVYREKKPILWCSSCGTALAEAEVEYSDHTSPSIYVKFLLEDDKDLRKQLGLNKEKIYVVIWTTTPWTIPANLAIALHPDLPYVAVKTDGEIWILAEGLSDQVMQAVERSDYSVAGKVVSKDLEKKKCRHPLFNRESLLIFGEHVTLEAGTGAVHTAPGHGQDDYIVGQKYGLDILAPVDEHGKFTNEVGIPEIEGMYVVKANDIIIEKLKQANALVKMEEVKHSYPHCWRCKRPIIFRSTEQWFVSMSHGDLRKRSLDAIEKVQWIPPWGKNRIGSMVVARPDWCISRQRVWGVPIVAVKCEACNKVQTSEELISNVAQFFEKEGSDSWFARKVEDFLPSGFSCQSCKGKKFSKEIDILDVWFDSGVSYSAVLEKEYGKSEQADLYLEGSDQHRGWFQASLLTSVETRGRAPYKRVLTHGFVIDGGGKKYSKSAGNYIPPEELIKKYGAEILRLWVASEDYKDDIRFSEEILTRLVDSYRKIRNTCRYIVSNLYDFNPEKDAVAYDKLEEMDRFALHKLQALVKKVMDSYEQFEFYSISHELNRFCVVDLSAFIFDIMKDRMYCEKKDGIERRSGQTVLWNIGEALVRLMAPILSFTADELWKHMPSYNGKTDSVFLTALPESNDKYIDDKLAERWDNLRVIREIATKALEMARAEKVIGNSLEAKLILELEKNYQDLLSSFGKNLSDLFIVSSVEFGKVTEGIQHEDEAYKGIKVGVKKANGNKCLRCWKFSDTVGENKGHPELCVRCASVVE